MKSAGSSRIERRHELLVVDPERVRRVVGDPGELFAADADVLVHRALTLSSSVRVYQGRTFTKGYTTR